MQQTPVERYGYDADGARVRKESKTEVTRYIGSHYEVTVAITNSQVLTTTKYYDFGDQRIAVRQNGTLSYLHGDHLGSTSVATSNTGATTSNVRYFAYGGLRTGNLFALPTDHAFTGQKLDKGTGLMYYGARYYDSGLGTFVSPDSIVPEPGRPIDLNRYAYVRNNPLNYADPTGHWPVPPIGPIAREVARQMSNLPWMTSVAYASYREAQGDAPEALSLTLDWYFERGEAPRDIGSQSEVTQFLITSQGMQDARQKFIEGSGQDMIGVGAEAHHHEFTWEAVPELYKGVFKDDWSGSFLGSFDVEFRNLQSYEGRGKLVEVTVVNDTGWQSATKIPFTKITIRQNVDRSEPGPGGTLWQYYRWQEVIYAE
jgi:RHS repeat-associated protein